MLKGTKQKVAEQVKRVQNDLKLLEDVEERDFMLSHDRQWTMPECLKNVRKDMEVTLTNLERILSRLEKRKYGPVRLQKLTRETKKIMSAIGMKAIPVIKIGYWENPAEAKNF